MTDKDKIVADKDKIKSMTDEELTDFISDVYDKRAAKDHQFCGLVIALILIGIILFIK